MAKGTGKPGATVTRKVSKGPNKGDTVEFHANSASAEIPGKLVPRRVLKDVGTKNTASTLPKGKSSSSSKSSSSPKRQKRRFSF